MVDYYGGLLLKKKIHEGEFWSYGIFDVQGGRSTIAKKTWMSLTNSQQPLLTFDKTHQ